MKSPGEYVADALPKRGEGSQTLMLVADAERAVAAAMADAEKYKDLLLRAIRNSKPTPSHATPTAIEAAASV